MVRVGVRVSTRLEEAEQAFVDGRAFLEAHAGIACFAIVLTSSQVNEMELAQGHSTAGLAQQLVGCGVKTRVRVGR